MSLRIIHTADWHIGQTFHDYDRKEEHLHFLNWLRQQVGRNQVDVLLVSGDVFDGANPSAESLQLFYRFLSSTVKENPGLQIVVTAGNHDSGQRLESPRPFLELEEFGIQNIHLIGTISRRPDGQTDYEKLLIPLHNRRGERQAWCMAVPFLRQGDTPTLPGGFAAYAAAVEAFYREALDVLQPKRAPGHAILAMGHLHASHAAISDMDTGERVIIGGVEGVPSTAFPEEIAYVALGHIHKAQTVGGKNNIRYSGSPLPMSFSEKNYKHRVLFLEMREERCVQIQDLEVPVHTPLISLPTNAAPIEAVLAELDKLPNSSGEGNPAPYLEVRVLEDQPDPGRKKKIQDALEGKHIRLAKITPIAAGSTSDAARVPGVAYVDFKSLKPEELFKLIYQREFGNSVPDDLLSLFHEIESTHSNSEN
jgi:exonuclease SbcD